MQKLSDARPLLAGNASSLCVCVCVALCASVCVCVCVDATEYLRLPVPAYGTPARHSESVSLRWLLAPYHPTGTASGTAVVTASDSDASDSESELQS